MSSKSDPIEAMPDGQALSRWGSLRLRLALWYGGLLAVALGIFATVVLIVATTAVNQSIDAAIAAEARIAQLDLHRELSSNPPYWPPSLNLPAVDTYRAPGIVVEVLDAQGTVRYRSSGGSGLPVEADTQRAALSGQTGQYTTTVEGDRVRVAAAPVRAPSAAAPVIGVLLVGKSLSDVDSTLQLLRTLLIIAGLATVAGAVLGGWAIATRVLHPISEIGATARAIAAATARGTRLRGLSRRARRPAQHDELAQLVDTFNEMLASLESATQIQRRFIADASHELRAPLTTVQGNLAFLQRHADELPPEERRTMLADAHAETLRLARLVDELLLLARADAGIETATTSIPASAARASPLPVGQVVELDRAILQLVRQLRGRLAAEHAPVRVEIGHIEPARVRGDEESLRRVALILLDNAIKYTPTSDGVTPGPVVVSIERREGQAVLSVRDSGIGIDAADLPHIFERFYRADRARDRQGTGLGLAIAHTLVERMGGRLTAESAPGAGSMFRVWLPLA